MNIFLHLAGFAYQLTKKLTVREKKIQIKDYLFLLQDNFQNFTKFLEDSSEKNKHSWKS